MNFILNVFIGIHFFRFYLFIFDDFYPNYDTFGISSGVNFELLQILVANRRFKRLRLLKWKKISGFFPFFSVFSFRYFPKFFPVYFFPVSRKVNSVIN